MADLEEYAPSILRLILGPLFLIPGVTKLMNPSMVVGMLQGLGFPMPQVWAWILIFSELAFGLAVLIGLWVRYTVWPLVIVLAVATVTVHIPAMAQNPMGIVNVLFHLLGITALISLSLSGAGAVAVDKE